MGNHFWVACAIWDGTESLTIVHAVNVNDTEALRKEVCRRDIALLALGLHDPLSHMNLVWITVGTSVESAQNHLSFFLFLWLF